MFGNRTLFTDLKLCSQQVSNLLLHEFKYTLTQKSLGLGNNATLPHVKNQEKFLSMIKQVERQDEDANSKRKPKCTGLQIAEALK